MRITALKTTLIVLGSLFFLFLVVWLGYSFYQMKLSSGTHVVAFVDIENQEIGKYFMNIFPKREDSDLIYVFPVKIERYTETPSEYTFTMLATEYAKSDDTFEYTLKKNQYIGSTKLEDLSDGSFVLLKLTYNIDQNLRYFGEYSLCTIKKIYSKMFNLSSPCASGNCYVQRDVVAWDMETVSKDSSAKRAYFDSYDKELLKKELLYFFMTNDYGYFNPTSFRYYSTQLSMSDGTFKFGSDEISNIEEGKNFSPVLSRFLSGVSLLVNTKEDIDWDRYLSTINGYIDKEGMGKSYFLNCKTSSFTISNLANCSSSACKEVKETALNYCKKSLDNAVERYEQDSTSISNSSSSLPIMKEYVFNIASEMIRFNNMVDDLGIVNTKYDIDTILSYYEKGKILSQDRDSIIAKCYSLDSAKGVYNQYSSNTIKNDIDKILTTIPELSSYCDTNSEDPFCSTEISEKLVCADALMGYRTEEAINLMSDIFYKHYSKSPGAIKMLAYETIRSDPFGEENSGSFSRFVEYGYFTFVDKTGDILNHVANMGDSYYFVNLLNRLSND